LIIKVAISFYGEYTVSKSKKVDVLLGGEIMELIKAVNDLSEDEALNFYENMFNALADKIRLKIINEISKSPNKNLCVCDIEEKLELKQSKLSYHLKKLVNANILIPEKHGTWNYYKINEEQIQVVLSEDTCCKIF